MKANVQGKYGAWPLAQPLSLHLPQICQAQHHWRIAQLTHPFQVNEVCRASARTPGATTPQTGGQLQQAEQQQQVQQQAEQQQTQAHALLPQLSGKAVILWDIENVGPYPPWVTVPVQLHRIQALLQQSGCSDVQIFAAMNPRSLARVKAMGLLAMLQACGVLVIQTPQHADAADVALISLGQQLMQHHREMQARRQRMDRSIGPGTGTNTDLASSGWCGDTSQDLVLVCLTQDTRFSQLLAYATDRGVYTVTIAPFQQGLRAAAAAVAPPTAGMQQNPLARASCAAVKWLPVSRAVTDEERVVMHNAQCMARQLMLKNSKNKAGGADVLYDVGQAFRLLTSRHDAVERSALLKQEHSDTADVSAAGFNLPRLFTMDVFEVTSAPGHVEHTWANPASLKRWQAAC